MWRQSDSKTASNPSSDIKPALAQSAWLSERGRLIAILAVIVLVGGLVRFANLGHSSLWCDEAWVGLQRRNDGFIPTGSIGYYGLLQNFFWDLSVWCFGDNEFSLRLPSALYGLATVTLAYYITRRLTASSLAGLCAGALALCNDNWLLFSRQCKPYAGEILAFAVVAYASVSQLRGKLNLRRAVLSLLLFVFAVGLGNTAGIIALPTISLALLPRLRSVKDRLEKGELLTMAMLLMSVSLITAAWFLWITGLPAPKLPLYEQVHLQAPQHFQSAYAEYGLLPQEDAGFPERIVWTLKGFFIVMSRLYPHWSKPGKLLWIVVSLATVWGIVRWPKQVNYYRVWIGVLLLLFAGLGFAGRYPWGATHHSEWVQLAILPFTGFALAQLLGRSGVRIGLLRTAFVFIVIAALGRQVYRTVVAPHVSEHSRPLIQYLERNLEKGDHIFVYRGAFAAFGYYWKGNVPVGIDKMSFSRGDREAWRAYLLKLQGKSSTTWMIFSHEGYPGFSESEFVQHELDKLDIRYDSFEEPGARLIRVGRQHGNTG